MIEPSNVINSRSALPIVLTEPPTFEYVVETDDDDSGALHTTLAGVPFCGVVRRGAEVTLVYSAPLSKTKEAAVRKTVKDHKAKRLVP